VAKTKSGRRPTGPPLLANCGQREGRHALVSQRLSLNVNGKVHSIDVDPDIPLLYALRNDIGLNNPRFGCGHESRTAETERQKWRIRHMPHPKSSPTKMRVLSRRQS
jgi:hypothetical protein